MTLTRIILSLIEGVGVVVAVDLGEQGHSMLGCALGAIIVLLAYAEGTFGWGKVNV